MTTINIVIGIGILFILVLLVGLFFMPTEKKVEKKKKKEKTEPEADTKDWQQTVTKLQHHVQSLHKQIEDLDRSVKSKDKQLIIEIAKAKKLQEKITQERSWHEKEKSEVDRKGGEFKKLQDELAKSQDHFSKEHALTLRLEQELKELRLVMDSTNSQRRAAEAESAQLKAQVESYRKDTAQLRRENTELSKKKEDASWIAKSEYERVEKLLREKEKEFERIKREAS